MLQLCDPNTGPEFIRNSNLGFRQFTCYGRLRNIPQYDHTTELSVHPPQEAQGNWESDQGPADSEYGDLEQEPRSDTDSVWQEQCPPEGISLSASHTSTLLEKDITPNNEIDGLLDNLDDMINRSPAAPLAVPGPRARRIELDKDKMDFSETLRLLQAPQSTGPERLPFKNLSNITRPQRHQTPKSPTCGRISFKLVTKPRRPGIHRPTWATSTAGASSDSPKTAGATPRDN